MNEISDKELREAIDMLRGEKHVSPGDFCAFMYCERCKEVHIFTKDTDVECIESLGLDFTSLKQ